MRRSIHRRFPKRRPLRYTREAATQSSGRYKANGDHQPGQVFKDPQGVKHTVPDKRKRKAQGKTTTGSVRSLRDA